MADVIGEIDPEVSALIRRMPKVELHLHLEGTLEPEHAFALAEKNGVTLPFASAREMRAAYDFTDLQSFLDLYYAACAVLRTRADFRDLTYAYLKRAHGENIMHVEPFFDPQSHTERGVPFEDVVAGILDGLAMGEADFGITSGLILSILRHLSADSAIATVAAAQSWEHHIVAIGLDSTEIGNPPERFAEVFHEARQLGWHCVAHAGEEGDSSLVARTLDALKVRRVDHGVRSAKDPAVMRRLAENDITLTLCPLSNLRLRVVERLADLPLHTLLDAGVAVTINSDDPAYFGGYLTRNLEAVAASHQLQPDDLYQLGVYAIGGSFASTDRKVHLMDALEDVFDGK